MRIGYAFLAKAAEKPPHGLLSVLGADFDSLIARQFPVSHPPMTLVMKVFFEPDEAGFHQLKVAFFDPSGSQIGETAREIEVGLNPYDPKRESGVGFVVELAVDFPEPGEYEFRLSIDDRHLETVYLQVNAQEDAPEGQDA